MFRACDMAFASEAPMGRRSSVLGVLVREMARSADRAAAEHRRQARRAQAIQGRAFEREMARYEREEERARVRAEREQERRKIAWERETAAQRKQDVKDAQLRAWKLEYDECLEREQEIDRIVNDAPEVEDRERLYSELAQRRTFVPVPFVAPAPQDSTARVYALRARVRQEVENATATFQPDVRALRNAQIGAVAAVLVGIGLLFFGATIGYSPGLLLLLLGLSAVPVIHLLIGRQMASQRNTFCSNTEENAEQRTQLAIADIIREDAARTEEAYRRARDAHEAQSRAAHAAHERAEEERLQALRDLNQGVVQSMLAALEEVLPLELPVPSNTSHRIESSDAVVLELELPEPTVIPTSEAKLLATGKVSYKDKNPKRLREQYLRLATGLIVRHASEVMLHLPTCQRIDVRAFRTMLDPMMGHVARLLVAEVQIDYAKLAPLTMEGLDPLLALENFEYRIHIDRNRELLPLRAKGA